MKLSRWELKFLLGSVLIILIIDSCIAGHKDDDDDDDDDDDNDCYPGRNCRPGCYCAGYCRPYFPPHSKYLTRYQCTGYNYPKWKVYKKGSKHSNGNSTVMVVIAHHHAELEPHLSSFLKENKFTTHDNYERPIPTGLKVLSQPSTTPAISKLSEVNTTSTVTTIIDLITAVSPTEPPLSS